MAFQQFDDAGDAMVLGAGSKVFMYLQKIFSLALWSQKIKYFMQPWLSMFTISNKNLKRLNAAFERPMFIIH